MRTCANFGRHPKSWTRGAPPSAAAHSCEQHTRGWLVRSPRRRFARYRRPGHTPSQRRSRLRARRLRLSPALSRAGAGWGCCSAVRVVVFGDFGEIPPLPDNGRYASTGLYAFESFSIPAQPAVVRSPWGEAHFLPFELVEQVRAAGDALHARCEIFGHAIVECDALESQYSHAVCAVQL